MTTPTMTSAAATSGIFDNGYVKFGYSGDGSFGYGGWQTPGIFYDATGSRNYPANADFLTPGSPWEFFAVQVGGSSYVNNNSNYTSPAMATTVDTSGVVQDGASTYGTVKFISTAGGLTITQAYTLGASAQVIAIKVTVQNTSDATIYGVKYARGIDPDVDAPLGTTATQNVRGADGIAESDIVLGTGPISGRVIGLYTNSSITHNTAVSPFWSSDPGTLLGGGANNNADSTINLAFDLGDLAAGQSREFSFAYVFAASAAALADSLAQVPTSNPAPVMTGFTDPVATAPEDQVVVLRFEDLLAQSGASDTNADGSAGSIAAFVVQGVASGTLRIGSTPETATAWVASSNDAIAAGQNLYWTPAADAHGTLPAFQVVARDAEGATSAARTVTVSITPVNDAPRMSPGAIALPAADEDAQPAGASVDSLFAPRFSDVDGDGLGGIVISGNAADPAQGAWQYSTDGGATWHDVGAVDGSAGLVLSAASLLRFLPAADWSGSPGSLTVHAIDATQVEFTSGATRVTLPSDAGRPSSVSPDARELGTSVTPANDAPVFDDATPLTATVTETGGPDSDVTVVSGALSGTLAASDPADGDAVSFGIRGGVAGTGDDAGSIVRQGTYGRLVLDPTSGEWHYEITNPTALNALPAGATATESFDFIATDGNGGQTLRNFTVTLEGANDVPEVQQPLADVTLATQDTWSYQVPAGTLIDPEGLGLSYAIALLDGDGNPVRDGDGNPVVLDGTGASHDLGGGAWVAFDPASRTITGATGGSTSAQTLQFQVVGTDPGGATASDTFTLTLEPTVSAPAAPAPDLAPVSTDARITLPEGGTHVLTLADFGHYADDAAGAPAQVRIVDGSGLVYDSTGSGDWLPVAAGQEFSSADIAAGRLQLVAPATEGGSELRIDYQVSDGSAWSDATYTLSAGVDEVDGTAIAATAVSSAAAGAWTAVYHAGAEAVAGFGSGTVRVVVDVTGGTIKLDSLPDGVDASFPGYGDATSGSATSIALEGTQAQVNAALQGLLVNRAAGQEASLTVTANVGGVVAGPNGRYYQVMGGSPISWADAKAEAEAMSFNGMQGYLATVTSQAENDFILAKLPADAWIGASDADTEGVWKWMTGPEAGQVISNGADPAPGSYANWNDGEPNDYAGMEDYAQFYASGGELGRWNDVDGTAGPVLYYVVEYGGMAGDAIVFPPATRTLTLGAPAAPVLQAGGTASYAENAVPVALAPGLVLTSETGGLAQATVQIGAGAQAGDRLAFAPDAALYGDIVVQGSYDAGSHTLTLVSAAGGATLAQWQAALASVRFSSTSDNPGTARAISWQVFDAEGQGSATAATSIAITPVNDAPSVTHLADPPPATPGQPWSFNTGAIFSDPEGGTVTYTASLADGSPLPAWLQYDPATSTFSGNPPPGTPFLDIKLTGTDSQGASAFTTFTLRLADGSGGATTANDPGTVSITGTAREGGVLSVGAVTDGDGRSAPATYQWQLSRDGGASWIDIAGATGSSFTLTQEQVGAQVRVQAFYNDDGGHYEFPVSTALGPIANVPDAGSGTISGTLGQGSTLVASFSDPDGIAGAVPTYQWYRTGSDGVPQAIDGATYSAYTLRPADGGNTISVVVRYVDDQGNSEEFTLTKPGTVDLAAIAPVAADDTGHAVEAGGLDNGTPGSDATGNLLANDDDANTGRDGLQVVAVNAGATLGVGAPATTAASGAYAGWLQLAGAYGTLYVDTATGAYVYQVSEDNAAVQALLSADTTLQDHFNYTVADPSGLTDAARLTITVSGQNDGATVTGFVDAAAAIEDVALRLPLDTLAITDPDGGATTLRLQVDAGTLSAASSDPGVTITGANTGTLTISAGTPFALSGWLRDNPVYFTTAPHDKSTVTLSYALDDGSGFKTLANTMAISTSPDNDAPIVDLDPDADGNDAAVTFRPRGEAVAVAPEVVIRSGDTAEDDQLLASATVAIASGADDNAFGTAYETLRTTHDGLVFFFEATGHSITIAGNGTPALTLSGSATRAEYELALRSIVYENANPNAAAGDRTVTIAVTDDAGQVSNAASFALAAANPDVTVGLRIFVEIDGVPVDTGTEVAEVSVDQRHFVASAPIAELPAGATIHFYGAEGALITSGTQSGPLVATVTVNVPWTPVIDMNGDATAGRDHQVTYTEGEAGAAIATPDASITDQDGKIASVVVTLANPLDGAAESLTLSGPVLAYMAARGITIAGNGSHAITLGYDAARFPDGLDATDFQVALRGVQYANTSDHPEVATQRIVTVTSTDVDGNTGVGARTLINVRNVNDAPVGQDHTLTIAEDTPRVLAVADFPFSDVEGNGLLEVRITSLPASGSLTLDGVAVTAGQFVTRADIEAGKLVFTPARDANGSGQDGFRFQVRDDGGTALQGVDLETGEHTLSFDVTPQNDAPVLTPGAPQLAAIGEDDVANAGQRVGDLLGDGAGRTGIVDVDSAPAGESHAQGIAIHALAAGGGTWQFSVDGGTTWLDVGTVGTTQALLLGANDFIRFVPDERNATTASFSYYLWDGATAEVAGQKADASVRGGTNAFSLDGDTASIVVTPVNDAATIEVGDAEVFRPRGGEVAVVGADFRIDDVDHAPDGTPDGLVGASVAITGGATDNLFTTYETLRPAGGATFVGADGGMIAISGNGTGADGLTGATALTLTGQATRAEYAAAIASIRYDNANPNATRGDREITITVQDASIGTGNLADGIETVAQTTVQVPWTPVVDLNGDAAAGRDHAVTYVERTSGVMVAASDAGIVDLDGNIRTLTLTLLNPVDGAAERLFVSEAMRTQISARGITVTVAPDGHSIVFSGDRDGTAFQFALRAVQYVNDSAAPGTTARQVAVETVDTDGNTGVGATTTIGIATVNDAPQGVDGTVTLDEDTAYTFGVADFGFTDVEGHGLAAVVIARLPAAGTLTLDGVAVTAGQEVSAADIAAGLLRYQPAPHANRERNAAPDFDFLVRDDGGTALGGADLATTPGTITLDIAPVNDLPTAADGTGTPSVAIAGDLREGQALTAVVDMADVDRDAAGIEAALGYQWQVRTVPDGAWVDVAGATASLHVLGSAETNLEIRVVVTYADTGDTSYVYTSDLATRPAIVGDADGHITLVLDTAVPVLIVEPQGNVSVTNTGSGALTVEGAADGSTVTVDTVGSATLSNPEGDLAVTNNGSGTVTVTGAPDGSALTTAGTGAIVVAAPAGDLSLDQQGTGPVSVDGLAHGAQFTATGAGAVEVRNPAGDLGVANTGTGVVTVRDLDAGSTLTLGGSGPVAVVSNLAAGERISVDTSGNGNVQLVNEGAGTIDVVGGLALQDDDGLQVTLCGDGTTAVTVSGTITLDGTPLRLELGEGYDPRLGDSITLMDNDGVDAVVGHFDGLAEGQTLYVGGELFRITYSGGTGNDVVLTRVNDAPQGSVTITGTVRQGETLTASHALTDTDGLGTVTYQWFANGALLAVGASYVLTQAEVGKAISVVASYTDAEGTTESVASDATAAVENVNDVPTGDVTITGTPELGQVLVASNTIADPDGVTTVHYQWQADGQDIEGATGSEYRIGAADIGRSISVVATYIDGFGHPERVAAAVPTAVVTDGNGVPLDVEAGVPGIGSGGARGDGNGDGVQDTLQPGVASMPLPRADGGAASYVTLVADSIDGSVREGSTDRVTDLHAQAWSSQLPSWAQAPVGALGFTAQVSDPGGLERFSLFVDSSLGVNGYWAVNAAGVLVNLASEAYGGSMTVVGDKLRLDFVIQDGGEFDHSAAGDQQIVAEGVAARAQLGFIGYVADTPVVPAGTNMWD